jgi:hypothetical protein
MRHSDTKRLLLLTVVGFGVVAVGVALATTGEDVNALGAPCKVDAPKPGCDIP